MLPLPSWVSFFVSIRYDPSIPVIPAWPSLALQQFVISALGSPCALVPTLTRAVYSTQSVGALLHLPLDWSLNPGPAAH